ncbi:chromosome partitioning protein, ParB family [Tessaracoccus bendigoensis DSM 12906]|uniref:Chromosome partitioning protein, ParB family n=1 Tax=Tessaracoccus bendigoensis DSM 12906 TaxID=1123357 RepID=A0A1M6NLY5_9ACTN|nr:ParB/RepB/Spo0J family partition protein [Tessaracoccus bendigoensis]SHJ96757.1 chromosome partitioning protein, ParB family [Tessaracoccus bendigoensis DSM 12906]
MPPKQSALGKGLGDLFARTDEDEARPLNDGSIFAEIPVEQIVPNPQQPREVFDEDELQELAGSIGEFGVLQPIVVRKAGRDNYELIMGERRLRASRIAGRATIPCIIRGTDDMSLLRDALLENLHRANLNAIEEARAYDQLLRDFACTKEDLANRIHRSRPQVSNTLRLLNLPPSVQAKVAAGVLSAGHARALLGLADTEAQERLAGRIIAEGLSVRSTEEIIALTRVAPGPHRPSAGRVPRQPSEHESYLSSRLTDQFDTRVKVNIGRDKGKIVIEFATGDDLDRIMAILEGKTI